MRTKSKILIVDDEAQLAKLFKFYLEKNTDYEIFTANSGKAAIEMVTQHKPDLVLLDIMMPDMNGLECLKRIKSIAPALPVTMVTALWEEETGQRALQAGAYDYITKPVDLNYLKMALQVKVFQ
ncbi:MAG: response regulator [Nitrospirae bacterium]|nr:response regulator [Nitrospirota bacterium]